MPDDGHHRSRIASLTATRTVHVQHMPVIELLHAASREASALFERTLRHKTITARQAMAIIILDRHPRRNQRELAELLGMDRSSLSVMLRRMEDAGIISRLHDHTDARIWRIELSRKGKAAVPGIQAAEERTMAIIRERIGDESLERATEALRRMLADIAITRRG